jgi:hypothetical protein
MFHQILPKFELAQKVDNFERGVIGLVLNDQRQRKVVVEFRKSKYSKFPKWEIVPLNSKCQLWMSKAIDQEEFWQGGLYKKCSS